MPQKLGQHFLADRSVLDRIAAAVCGRVGQIPDLPKAERTSPDLVIEIGPGKGALTEKLLDRAARVVAIEIDTALVAHLRARFPPSRLELIHADVLTVDLAQWGRAPIAGNLPYYITSPILEKAVRSGPPRAVFLMQKEVAQRLVAKPGTRDYGYLTVHTAMFAAARMLFDVKPGAFRPPPKVDSAVVLLEPREFLMDDRDAFLEFVGRAFRQKRKMLRNNLAGFYAKELIDSLPASAMRAEQLSLDQLLSAFTHVHP